MKAREWGNAGLHLVGGALIAAPVVWSQWFAVLATFIWAFLREQAQHRYAITKDGHVEYVAYQVQKRSFFDFSWLGGRQWFEIAQWTLGAALAVLVMEVIR